MKKSKPRNKTLDIARGLSIFLIVLSHTGVSWDFLFDFFYVQVFFFLSGIFLKSNNTFENTYISTCGINSKGGINNINNIIIILT